MKKRGRAGSDASDKIDKVSGHEAGRRLFFRALTGGAVGVAVAASLGAKAATAATASAIPGMPLFDQPRGDSGRDYIDGHDASVYAYTAKDGNLAFRGFEGKRWAMLVDLRKCIGCQACTAACKFENNVPNAVFRTLVPDVEIGRYPDTRRAFLPRLCNHCKHPSCIEVCPAGATWQRRDGIVVVDNERCIGCGACVDACPYDARFMNPVTKTADKCNFCAQRTDQGLLPACVETCVGGARQFGDLNDPNSAPARALQQQPVQVLKPETGNEPRVLYIGLPDALQNNLPGRPDLWSADRRAAGEPVGDWKVEEVSL